MRNTEVGKSCSFCGADGEHGHIAGGLGAMICSDCTSYFFHIFQDPTRFEDAAAPPWRVMTDVELLSQLPRIAHTGRQADDFLIEWVDLCRDRGLSWVLIGKALGTSTQDAFERFAHKVEDLQRARYAGQE